MLNVGCTVDKSKEVNQLQLRWASSSVDVGVLAPGVDPAGRREEEEEEEEELLLLPPELILQLAFRNLPRTD
ncbi:hypothetical protein EYF80_049845 [Liparis tanakae]|uniref:Uncharacterized protein n=1 Tax=Liparis tanakae TaxID=230148 RepID=A0A4Z2FI65_9TELE|nr:hypothetical protein EYF80_049845 [Liparis tanakae]